MTLRHVQAYLYRVGHRWITEHYRREPPLSVDPSLRANSDHDPSYAAEPLRRESDYALP